MWKLSELDEQAISNFAGMTFPRFRDFLGKPDSLALGATLFGQPMGLILASVPARSRVAEIRSLFVQPNQRNLGLGAQLLEAMEQRLSQRGFREAELQFKSDKPSVAAFERVLAKRGWEASIPGLLVFEARAAEVLTAPWLCRPLPAGWTIFPWGELCNRERWSILQEDQTASWRTLGLNPFWQEEGIEPEASLGLRCGETLVGWLVTHRSSTTHLRYSVMYVRDEHQRMGRAIFLLHEALRRQVALGIPFSSWLVSPSNLTMRRFVERRLKPYLLSSGAFRHTQKQL